MNKSFKVEDHYEPVKQPLEFRIGLYWLHKLGIISLVFGIVFLITYSFQLIGPAFKLFIGAAVSVLLIFFGERMAIKEKQKWFGHGLTAGGWSLAYFTTYAAHYLAGVQVISSLFVETIVLLTVAGGSLVSALRARSEVMAILSVSLASTSIMLSGPSALSDVSFVVIAIACSVLGNFQNWKGLFASGLLGCYLGHFICQYPSWAVIANDVHGQTIASLFLALIWLVFSVGIGYSMKIADDTQEKGKFGAILSYLNAAAFAIGLLLFNGREMSHTTEILLSGAGAVYLGIARWLIKRKHEQTSAVHSIIGLSLINGAKAMHFSGLTLIILDIIQIGLLATIGLRYNIKSFRAFAVFLASVLFPIWIMGALQDAHDVVFGFRSFEYVKVGILAVGVLAPLSWLYVRSATDWSEFGGRDKGYADFYYLAANAMASLMILTMVDHSWQLFALSLQAVVNNVTAIKLEDDFYGLVGTLYLCASAFFLMMSFASWAILPIVLVAALFYCAYAYLVSVPVKGSIKAIIPMHAHVASIVLTGLLLQKLPSEIATLGIGIEGITLLLTGFLLSSRLFRIWGLSVLATMTGKLLFLDMAHYNTFERIISFIAAGLVFLLSSYAYARYTRAFEEEESESRADLPG